MRTLYVLVLDPSLDKVHYYEDLPLDAAIAINLFRMSDFDRTALQSELETLDPSKSGGWMEFFVDQHQIASNG